MKKIVSTILISTILLNSCKNIDLSPDYSGSYKVSALNEVYQNGKLVGKQEETGILKVTHGANQKTVMLSIFVDANKNPIEIPIKLGVFSTEEKTNTNGCTITETIKGQFNDTILECSFTGNQKCPKEEVIISTTLKGFRN
jgi:hypothetical protein